MKFESLHHLCLHGYVITNGANMVHMGETMCIMRCPSESTRPREYNDSRGKKADKSRKDSEWLRVHRRLHWLCNATTSRLPLGSDEDIWAQKLNWGSEATRRSPGSWLRALLFVLLRSSILFRNLGLLCVGSHGFRAGEVVEGCDTKEGERRKPKTTLHATMLDKG